MLSLLAHQKPQLFGNCGLGIVVAGDGMASYVANYGTQELKMFHGAK